MEKVLSVSIHEYTDTIKTSLLCFFYSWTVFIVPLIAVILFLTVFRNSKNKKLTVAILSILSVLSALSAIVYESSKEPYAGVIVDSLVLVFDIIFSFICLAHIIFPIVFIIILLLKKNTKKKTIAFIVLETLSVGLIGYFVYNSTVPLL